ncbi:MAG: protein kinase [Kiritimatiellae bacterium]|nr:protein kinase [Kiritimatiellia bacterium]
MTDDRGPSPGEMPLISTAGNLPPVHPVALPLPIVPGYSVLRAVGQGGMCVVYEAWQEKPRRRVALKLLLPSLISPVLLRRFSLEVEILGRLEHPAIARIYEAGATTSGSFSQPFFAMEFIEGVPITEYVRQHTLSIPERVALLKRVVDGVHHAHQRGIIHRDLKPSNILVDANGQPKILDFGVSRLTEANIQITTAQKEAGIVIGTLSYMSPEQADGQADEIDVRTDIYALGVIGFEVLTGERPYRLDTQMIHEAVRMLHEQEPTRLGMVNRAFRGDLEIIVRKAMEKEKERRFASASALADDLQRYLNNEPITARSPSTWYRATKFVRRHKALVGSAAAMALALVSGLILAHVGLFRARRAEEKARRAEREAVQNQERAQANLLKAMDTVDQFMTVVAQGTLADVPGAAPAREQLLRDAVAFYEQFVAENQQDERLQRELNWALTRLGGFYRQVEKWPEAMEIWKRKLSLLEKRLAAEPHNSEHQRDLVRTYVEWAEGAKRQGAVDAAQQAFEKALTIGRALAEQHPESQEYQQDLARALNGLGRLFRQRKNLAASRLALEESLAIGRKLTNQYPDNAECKEDLTLALDELARTHNDSRDVVAAEAVLAESYSLYKDLLRGHPSSRDLRMRLGRMLGNWEGPGKQSRLEEANAIWRALAQDYPADPAIRRSLAWNELELKKSYPSDSPPPAPPSASRPAASSPPSETAGPVASAEAPPATEAPVRLDAQDIASQLRHAGQHVIVRGNVLSIIRAGQNQYTYINFSGNDEAHIQCIVHRNVLPSFTAVHGENLRAIAGQEVEIDGIINVYKGIPEIILTRPDQIRLISVNDSSLPVISATALDELRAYKGKRITVEGRIDGIGASPTSALTFLNFGKTTPGHFTAIIRKKNMEALVQALGGHPSVLLNGRTVRISGLLYYHQDVPNMEILEPGQISIVSQAPR